jgi:uncharacterized membrane protein
MASVTTSFGFQFGQPYWLLAAGLAPLLIAWAWRDLAPLGRSRQVAASVCRALVLAILAGVLAQPALTSQSRQLTVITVFDRSLSVPPELQNEGLSFLAQALAQKPPEDLLAVVDVAEAASISKLPTTDVSLRQRNTSLTGSETRLASGVEMAMAIAPPTSAARILLVSDGKETSGDLRESARIAAANGIPIDVLPLKYRYDHEVVFKSLVAPVRARSGQTIPLRFVLSSTGEARGRLVLSLNGKSVALDPALGAVASDIELKPGTNVKTVSLPVGSRGVHEFEASFIPLDPGQDSIEQNNHASAITFVAGPGHVLVVEGEGAPGAAIKSALQAAQIDARELQASEFPTSLASLMDCDAVILANLGSSELTFQQQEMLARYVAEMGGGLVMVGGPNSFGAGGWIGSPLAEVLPVDLDPPQKKQMPKGALVLIMHACEMPQGNFWSKKVAVAAVDTLSRLDLAGVLEFGWQQGAGNWVYPLSEVGDKKAIVAAVNQMQMGDMPDFGAPMQEAYDKLVKCQASAKHVIIISDGDPQMPTRKLLDDYKKAGITVSGVCVWPHMDAATTSLKAIADYTGGRFYPVKDAQTLPQIFIKEAQVVRRALIVEETIKPLVTFSMNEIVRGLDAMPALDGFVLTGPKGGLAQLVMTTDKGDPLLAAGQSGLGRSVAFTSSADARWAKNWLAWGGFARFWEQAVRWAAKPSQGSDCEVFTDVQGRDVTVTVESADVEGKSVQFSQIAAQVIAPDLTTKKLALTQVGPGRYRAEFRADQGGSYLLNLRYTKAGSQSELGMHSAVIVPYAPEFRDLADNTPLLAEAAALTGGRVVGSDPKKADLYNRSGVKFPQSELPLTQPLLLAWLAIFILDVAVRRLAVDVRPAFARLAEAARRLRPTKKADVTLDRLKTRRQEFLAQAASRRKPSAGPGPGAGARSAAVSAARFEAPADTKTDLRAAGQEAAGQRGEPAAPAAAPQAPPPPEEVTPIQQLLKAKKQAQDRLRKKPDG